jgi:hypothetical protein
VGSLSSCLYAGSLKLKRSFLLGVSTFGESSLTAEERAELERLREEYEATVFVVADLRLKVSMYEAEIAQKDATTAENGELRANIVRLEKRLGVLERSEQASKGTGAAGGPENDAEELVGTTQIIGKQMGMDENGIQGRMELRPRVVPVEDNGDALGDLFEANFTAETEVVKKDLAAAENTKLRAEIARLEEKVGALEGLIVGREGPGQQADSGFLGGEYTPPVSEHEAEENQGNPELDSEWGGWLQENRADQPGESAVDATSLQAAGTDQPPAKSGASVPVDSRVVSEEQAEVPLQSQESEVEAFSWGALLGATVSSFSSSEPATRTNSLGAFEIAGLGARAFEPRVSGEGLPSLPEGRIPAEFGECDTKGAGKSLVSDHGDGLLKIVESIPLEKRGAESAIGGADVQFRCNVSCQTDTGFEVLGGTQGFSGKLFNGSGDPLTEAREASALGLVKETSGKEVMSQQEPMDWESNPLALFPCPSTETSPERTPQGSFDLPVRVGRLESMLSGSGNGTTAEPAQSTNAASPAAETALGRSEAQEVVLKLVGVSERDTLADPESTLALDAESPRERESNSSSSYFLGISSTIEGDCSADRTPFRSPPDSSDALLRSPLEPFDLPVRVGRLESILDSTPSGGQKQDSQAERSPSSSFDLPVRVSRLESMLGGVSSGDYTAGERADRSPLGSFDLPVRVNRLESLVSDRATRKSFDSFDLPERVARLESMLGALSSSRRATLADRLGEATEDWGQGERDFRVSSFELPQRVELAESILGEAALSERRTEGSGGKGTGAEGGIGGKLVRVSGKEVENSFVGGQEERMGTNQALDLAAVRSWEAQVEGLRRELEAYQAALVDLPALMFETALLKRQLKALRRKQACPPLVAEAEQKESGVGRSDGQDRIKELEVLIVELRGELTAARRMEQDVKLVKEELLRLRSELAEREEDLTAAAEALQASEIQGLAGLGRKLMHRLSLSLSERDSEEWDFALLNSPGSRPRAKSESAAAGMSPMIVGLRRDSLRGLEVLAKGATASERLRAASAPALRSALEAWPVETAEETGSPNNEAVVSAEFWIGGTEIVDAGRCEANPTPDSGIEGGEPVETESFKTDDVPNEKNIISAGIQMGGEETVTTEMWPATHPEALVLHMDRHTIPGTDPTVEQELRDEIVSLSALLAAREHAHKEVPALREEVSKYKSELRQLEKEHVAHRDSLEREISRLCGALEESETRAAALCQEVLQLTRTRVESGPGQTDELWMVVPRAAAGMEGEEALRQQVQHLQVSDQAFLIVFDFCQSCQSSGEEMRAPCSATKQQVHQL